MMIARSLRDPPLAAVTRTRGAGELTYAEEGSRRTQRIVSRFAISGDPRRYLRQRCGSLPAAAVRAGLRLAGLFDEFDEFRSAAASKILCGCCVSTICKRWSLFSILPRWACIRIVSRYMQIGFAPILSPLDKHTTCH